MLSNPKCVIEAYEYFFEDLVAMVTVEIMFVYLDFCVCGLFKRSRNASVVKWLDLLTSNPVTSLVWV